MFLLWTHGKSAAVFCLNEMSEVQKEFNMLLLCFGIYLVLGLLFTTLYWMSVAVGKKHDEEKGYR